VSSLKIEGTYTIAASPAIVYETLRDPKALEQCIPGCQELTLQEDGRFLARMQVGIAAVKGSFVGHVQITDEQPLTSYRLRIDGSGGPGFAKGEALVKLVAVETGTRVDVDGEGQVGGMIAAVGQRVLLPAARSLMNQFFGCMQSKIEAAARG
ncbi:MAG: SRPBCC family protein, partial [Chloroflexota bacterium]